MKICVLSRSRLADDPRVRRQGDALANAGYEVVALGLAGSTAEPPPWATGEIAPSVAGRASSIARSFAGACGSRAALHQFWQDDFNHRALDFAISARADVYQANDWNTLPIAAEAALAVGGRYLYDSHEFAIDEAPSFGLKQKMLRQLFRRQARSIERRYIHGADAVTTVSPGIASALREEYGLSILPTVVRNVPPFQEIPFRPAEGVIEVLFHGALSQERCLDALIKSVPMWSPEFRLVIRGGTNDREYRRHLGDLARRPGAAGRVAFEDPVPMLELIRRAGDSDVGVVFIEGSGPQRQHSLPNKLFEYVMAGLAIVASATPALRDIVEGYELGELVPDASADQIANTVNSLTHPVVNASKRRSLAAAQDLCWEHEQERMLSLYRLDR